MYIIREMKKQDYSEIYALWQITSRRALSSADSKESICAYLDRNKGISQVAVCDGAVVGTVLAGHDGRRGFIYHMAVLPQYRRRGIARAMAQKALKKIEDCGIEKTHIFCYCDNSAGQAFWRSMGFVYRGELAAFSRSAGE